MRNDEETVNRISRVVLTQKSDLIIKPLLSSELSGVQLPVASAILTVLFPKEYCITD